MKPTSSRQALVIALLLFSLQLSVHAAEPEFLIMPKQLVLEADRHGCEQIKDFFSATSAYGPPFVYGIVRGDDLSRYYGLNSAAFWCRKKGTADRYFLIATVNDDLKDLFRCSSLVVEIRDYIGALSVKNDTWDLSRFRDTKTGRPVVQKAYRATAIISSTEAYEDIFLCHDGRWVRKERD